MYFSTDSSQVGFVANVDGVASRSSQSKMQDHLDLRDFNGLDLTGGNDCTSILAKAMDQTISGRIDVPLGTIAVEDIVPKSNIHLNGQAQGGSIFKFIAPGTAGLYSGTKGLSQLLYFKATDIQFLDDAGLGTIVDLTDMMFSRLIDCFTYGFGATGSIGVRGGSSNTSLQCTYNRIIDHYYGNTQYGLYATDGFNSNKTFGGRAQSSVANAVGAIFTASTYDAVNSNSLYDFGVETPCNTMDGIQLNGNTVGMLICKPRCESLKNAVIVSASDTQVGLVDPYYSDCTNNLVDASGGKAFLNGNSTRGMGGPAAQFSYVGGTTPVTNKAINCSISRSSAGVYNISGLPFSDAYYSYAFSSNLPTVEVTSVTSSSMTITLLSSGGVATDGQVSGIFFE